MPTIETKFAVGGLVKHFTGVPGMVTAIFHRAGKNMYEFSFLHDDKPTCVNAEDCELFADTESNMGFRSKD